MPPSNQHGSLAQQFEDLQDPQVELESGWGDADINEIWGGATQLRRSLNSGRGLEGLIADASGEPTRLVFAPDSGHAD
jgi:hypothetical protein